MIDAKKNIGESEMNPDISKDEIKYKIIPLEQRSPEWKAFRKGKIGASQIAAILGIDPFRTKLQLWEDMIFDRQVEVTKHMQRGIDREQEALDWFCHRTSILFFPAVLQSIEFPWMIASLDGFFRSREGDLILEIKWPSKQSHENACKDIVPEYYYPQLQFQVYIAGSSQAVYLSCFENDKHLIVVPRDQKYIDDMLPKVHAFHQSLIDFKPPEACERDRVDVNDLELATQAERYVELDRLIGELELEKEEIRKMLVEGSDHPRFTIGPVKVSRYVREGVVEWKSIPELKDVDLSPYRKKPVVSWRISYD